MQQWPTWWLMPGLHTLIKIKSIQVLLRITPSPDRYYGGQQLGPSPLTDGHVLQTLPRYDRSCTPRRHAISGWACVTADGRDR